MSATFRRLSSLAPTATVPRTLKSKIREMALAKGFLEEASPKALTKLNTLSRKMKYDDEVSSRIAAYGATLALDLNHIKDAEVFLKRITYSPPVIRRSIFIRLLCIKGDLDGALDAMETCLNEEEYVPDSVNSCITNESLDILHDEIQKKSDSQKQMQRFRKLQRLITSFNRRTTMTNLELLNSPLVIEQTTEERHYSEKSLPDRVIEETPHFLEKSRD